MDRIFSPTDAASAAATSGPARHVPRSSTAKAPRQAFRLVAGMGIRPWMAQAADGVVRPADTVDRIAPGEQAAASLWIDLRPGNRLRRPTALHPRSSRNMVRELTVGALGDDV